VRGSRTTARLVGLVRGVHARSSARQHRGGGRRGCWSLHGGGQARCRLACLTPATASRKSQDGARVRQSRSAEVCPPEPLLAVGTGRFHVIEVVPETKPSTAAAARRAAPDHAYIA